MRTKLIIGCLGLVVAAAFLFTPAPASTTAPAVVIKDSGCVMLDGDGFLVFTPSNQAVITSSGQGKLSCKASGLANSTGRASIFNNANTGLLCFTMSDLTAQWNNVVSASGQGTLTCQNDG